MDPDAAVLVALLVKRDGRLIAVQVECVEYRPGPRVGGDGEPGVAGGTLVLRRQRLMVRRPYAMGFDDRRYPLT